MSDQHRTKNQQALQAHNNRYLLRHDICPIFYTSRFSSAVSDASAKYHFCTYSDNSDDDGTAVLLLQMVITILLKVINNGQWSAQNSQH